MAVTMTAKSPLGMFLAPQIKNFMDLNANTVRESGEIADGTKAIAEAIAYGVAKALGSPIFLAALAAGTGPVGVGAAQVASLTPNVIADQA